MRQHQELQLPVVVANGAKERNQVEDQTSPRGQEVMMNQLRRRRYYRWLRVSLYTTFVLLGQSSATLLQRLYYDKGGKSKWMGTLVQIAGFPVLLPYNYFIIRSKPINKEPQQSPDRPTKSMLAFVYVSLGLLVALDCFLYSIGLWYLPVSTFSLICSSQLAFNAFFSYFLNSLKFTPYIVNSFVILTISSALLVLEPDSSGNPTELVSKNKYVIGFICTVVTSAGYGLLLSLTQLAFRKVLKRQSFDVIMDMIVYQSMVATAATVVGMFASGEWSGLHEEMEGYEMGKGSYVLNLVFTAVIWQVFSVGCVGLILEVSSLFANSISVLAVPVVPILAVVFFKDKMHGIKAISMVLALWGIISYVYQHYLDEKKPNTTSENIHASISKPPSSPLVETN